MVNNTGPSPEHPPRRPAASERTADAATSTATATACRCARRPPAPRSLPPPAASSARRLLLPLLLLLPASPVRGGVAPPIPVPESPPPEPPAVLRRLQDGGSAADATIFTVSFDSSEPVEVSETIEVFDTFTLVLGGLCANDNDWTPSPIGGKIKGLSEEILAAMERATLDHFRREVESGCDGGSDANYTAVTVVSFEEGTECQEARGRGLQNRNKKKNERRGKQMKSTVKGNRRYLCRRCPPRDAELLPEGPTTRDSLALGNRALLRKDDGDSRVDFYANCSEDRLLGSLRAEPELEKVITSADITAIDVKDCARTSPDCVSEDQEDFGCCGADGCQCRMGSESNCAQEGCLLMGEYRENLCCATGESGADFLFGVCGDRCQMECAAWDYMTPVEGTAVFSFLQRLEVLNLCGDDEANAGEKDCWGLTPKTRAQFEGDLPSYLNVEMNLDGCGPYVTFEKVSMARFMEKSGCKDKRSGNSGGPGQSIVEVISQGTCNAYCPSQMKLGEAYWEDAVK